MRDDARRPPAFVSCSRLVELDAEAVVGVPVGEDGGVESDVAPASERRVNRGCREPTARVGEHEAVVPRWVAVPPICLKVLYVDQ
jgi:hypothetical protein